MTESATESEHEESSDTNSDTNSDTIPDAPTGEQLESERAERLDPENRPDGAEVDNTEREFDPEKGMFTDSEGHDEAEKKFPPAGQQGA